MAFTDDLASKLWALPALRDAKECTPPEYASLKYPRLVPIMKFSTMQVRLPGFGSLMMLETTAMSGMMKLLTLSFMPFEGKSVPYLLIDCMAMKKKSLAYVEYYNCTGRELMLPNIMSTSERYAALPDYAEKAAWYVPKRMKGSLIKGGEGADADKLGEMALACAEAYLTDAAAADTDPANVPGLEAFRSKMLTLGNPASDTLVKVLGTEGAERFFCTAVMPLK